MVLTIDRVLQQSPSFSLRKGGDVVFNADRSKAHDCLCCSVEVNFVGKATKTTCPSVERRYRVSVIAGYCSSWSWSLSWPVRLQRLAKSSITCLRVFLSSKYDTGVSFTNVDVVDSTVEIDAMELRRLECLMSLRSGVGAADGKIQITTIEARL